MTNLDSSKLKTFADDNFKFDENGWKLSKRVENTVGKGESVCNEQFLLFLKEKLLVTSTICPFPTVFSRDLFPRGVKGVVVWPVQIENNRRQKIKGDPSGKICSG